MVRVLRAVEQIMAPEENREPGDTRSDLASVYRVYGDHRRGPLGRVKRPARDRARRGACCRGSARRHVGTLLPLIRRAPSDVLGRRLITA